MSRANRPKASSLSLETDEAAGRRSTAEGVSGMGATPGKATVDIYSINSPKLARQVVAGGQSTMSEQNPTVMRSISTREGIRSGSPSPPTPASGTPSSSSARNLGSSSVKHHRSGDGSKSATSSTRGLSTTSSVAPSSPPRTPANNPAPDNGAVPASLSSLLHQADRHGRQQKAVATPGMSPSRGTPSGNWAARTPSSTPSHAAGYSQMGASHGSPITQVTTGGSSRNTGAGAMPSPSNARTPAPLPSRRAVMAPTPVNNATVQNSARSGYPKYPVAAPGPQPLPPAKRAVQPARPQTFWERLGAMLCCYSPTVTTDALAPSPYNNKMSTPTVNTSNMQHRAVGAEVRSGNRKFVKRKWVRPPPPETRINHVIRPSSTYGDGPMLGPVLECDRGRKCLVLDLDETLVHSSFRPVPNPDYILPVEIDGTIHSVYVIKRPGCDEFLQQCGQMYEVVVFTASLAKYADPLLDLLDPYNVIRARLFREACVQHEGSFVKDLSLLGRDPTDVIIIDNSPASYMFQPENALPCESFIDDMADRELWTLLNFLDTIARVEDVRDALLKWVTGTFNGLEGLPVRPDAEEFYLDVEVEEEDVRAMPTIDAEADAQLDATDRIMNHPISELVISTPADGAPSPHTRVAVGSSVVTVPSKSSKSGTPTVTIPLGVAGSQDEEQPGKSSRTNTAPFRGGAMTGPDTSPPRSTGQATGGSSEFPIVPLTKIGAHPFTASLEESSKYKVHGATQSLHVSATGSAPPGYNISVQVSVVPTTRQQSHSDSSSKRKTTDTSHRDIELTNDEPSGPD